VIPTAFEYERAASLDDALAKLKAADGDAKLLAGGHSLIPLMKLRLSEPKRLIDISRIPDLGGLREKAGRIEIGAATTHHAVATSGLLREKCPVLAEAAAEIGDPQVRNRGTLGGSLAHADPSADYPAVMLALDAEIHVRSASGSRAIKASDFFQDLFTVDLRPDEIITGIQVAPVRSAAYAKLHQRASHYAIVGVAAALEAKGGTITSARIGTHRRRSERRAPEGRGGRAGGQAALEGDSCGGGEERGSGARLGERRHPCERGVPPGDGVGLHAAGARGSDSAGLSTGGASRGRRTTKGRRATKVTKEHLSRRNPLGERLDGRSPGACIFQGAGQSLMPRCVAVRQRMSGSTSTGRVSPDPFPAGIVRSGRQPTADG
jgi:carbon-monoxide dehydrogenase medium subunit